MKECMSYCLIGSAFVGSMILTMLASKKSKRFTDFMLLLDEEQKQIYRSVIDGIVFELYFPRHMQEKQIDILQFVEKDLGEVMQNRNLENLPNNEKENIIHQLHVQWSHPDSEVRNRIKLFAVRSPNILKPILETKSGHL